MLVLIRGAGDIATGIALRLYRTGIQVVMTVPVFTGCWARWRRTIPCARPRPP